jgi:predicted dehydrogenase
MIRCAIVGAGAVVEDLHLPAFRGLPQVKLAALCEPDPTRARRLQDRSAIPRAYATLDELLADDAAVDFVDIATPAHTHYELVRQALEAGLHVLVEKPLALTARQGAELDELARINHLKLCVLQTYRFRGPVLSADGAIAAGQLGTISQMNITCHWGHDLLEERRGWDWPEKAASLLLYELGVHYVDLALHFAGPVADLAGFHAVTDADSGAVTAVSTLLEHENGAITLLDLASRMSSRFVRLELFGSRADGRIKLFPEAFTSHSGSLHPLKEIKEELRRTADFIAESVVERLRAKVKRRALPHFRVISGFVAALEDPALDAPVTAASAVRTLEVLDALYRRIPMSPAGRASIDPQPALSRVI